LCQRIFNLLAFIDSFLWLSLNKVSQHASLFLNEQSKPGIRFFAISNMYVSHLNKSFFAFTNFLFNNFIGTIVIEINLFLNLVHLNKRKSYEMLDIKAVVVKNISDVLDLVFDVITCTVDSFHFLLCLSFLTKL
jgi:hypothetical protein